MRTRTLSDPAVSSAIDPDATSWPVVEDHDAVGDLLHLVELMARDQHGAALAGEVAEEAAQPADAVGIEPVGRLVEHEHLRVAEQRRGQAEALPHAQRVAADLALAGIAQPDQLEHLVGAPSRQAGGRAQDAQVVACGASRVEARRLERGADDAQRGVQPRVRQRRRSSRARQSGAPDPSTMRSVVVLPAPFGPRKPVTEPGSTVKLSRSTARILPPKTLVRSSTTIRPAPSTPAAASITRLFQHRWTDLRGTWRVAAPCHTGHGITNPSGTRRRRRRERPLLEYFPPTPRLGVWW